MTASDGSIPVDGNRGDDPDEDLHGGDPGERPDEGLGEGPERDLMERLRHADPVDVDALPSSRSAEAMKTLNQILGPAGIESGAAGRPEAGAGTEGSSPSPTANSRGEEDAPPPCPKGPRG